MCPNVFSESAFYVLSKQLPASCFFSSSNRCGRKRELLATWVSHSASWKLKVPKSIWRHPKECQRISRRLSPTISRRNLVQYRLNHVKFTSPVVHCSGKLLTANFCHWNPLEMPSASVSSEDGFWVRRMFHIIGGQTEGLNELAFLAPTWRVSVRPSNQSHPLATVVRAKSIEMQKTLNFTT